MESIKTQPAQPPSGRIAHLFKRIACLFERIAHLSAINLVFKMSASGENHRNTVFVARFNHGGVVAGTAGLDNSANSVFRRFVNRIGKRE
ncbi:MAG: hypothetical protein LBL62_10870, partial [Planctomycetaceae bacterium]|nr:hypothetical protein [Planctomycetaceae bacterium]